MVLGTADGTILSVKIVSVSQESLRTDECGVKNRWL
jgi:hypothetical protein